MSASSQLRFATPDLQGPKRHFRVHCCALFFAEALVFAFILCSTAMALVALPAELRSLCRRLASSKPDALLGVLPSLLDDVLRCEVPLSRPHESKGADLTAEASALVHKLKTQVTTLLQGRSAAGRFAGVALAKAVVEAGGWECLQTSEPWVRGLLSILQVSLGREPTCHYCAPSTRLTRTAEERSCCHQGGCPCHSGQDLHSDPRVPNLDQRDCHADIADIGYNMSADRETTALE